MDKPNLLFFRPKYGPSVPEFLCIHRDEHMRCLSQFFTVTIIEDDCDFQRVCDLHEPDACLVEIGLQASDTRQPRIARLGGSTPIPRLAFMNADPWGHTRSRILAEVEAVAFDAVFAISTTAGEHLPHLKDRLFYWPNFIDPNVFRDYRLPKQSLLLLTGDTGKQYPWRRKVWHALRTELPVLQLPHAGYCGRAETGIMTIGSAYAEKIAGAWFAPTCGTVANDLLRKHLEIPAVGTCLITERTPTLERAGFTDMRNVVFATERDVVEKVKDLVRHPDTLRQIIANGLALVHERHTMRARSQVSDWLRLHRAATDGESLVQPDPFGPLVLDRRGQGATSHMTGAGAHLRLLDEALAHVDAGRTDLALPVLTACKEAMPLMLDTDLLRAHCALAAGDPEQALRLLVPMLKASLDANDSLPPDPVEWAHLIIALLAMGRMRAACRHARAFCEISHPQLDRARAAVFFLRRQLPPAVQQRKVASLHRLDTPGVSDWMAWLAAILRTCGRLRHARRLASAPWALVRDDTEILAAMPGARERWRRAKPMASRRLRRWDNPLVTAVIRQRAASLVPLGWRDAQDPCPDVRA
jgi:hypothetical protein